MNKMKHIFLLIISISIFSCEKEKCYTVEGKEIINGEYYFLLENNDLYSNSRSENLSKGYT